MVVLCVWLRRRVCDEGPSSVYAAEALRKTYRIMLSCLLKILKLSR